MDDHGTFASSARKSEVPGSFPSLVRGWAGPDRRPRFDHLSVTHGKADGGVFGVVAGIRKLVAWTAEVEPGTFAVSSSTRGGNASHTMSTSHLNQNALSQHGWSPGYDRIKPGRIGPIPARPILAKTVQACLGLSFFFRKNLTLPKSFDLGRFHQTKFMFFFGRTNFLTHLTPDLPHPNSQTSTKLWAPIHGASSLPTARLDRPSLHSRRVVLVPESPDGIPQSVQDIDVSVPMDTVPDSGGRESAWDDVLPADVDRSDTQTAWSMRWSVTW